MVVAISCQLAHAVDAKKELLEQSRTAESDPITVEIANKTKQRIIAAYKNGPINQAWYGCNDIRAHESMRLFYGVASTKVPFPQIIIRTGTRTYIIDFEPAAGHRAYKATVSRSPDIPAEDAAAAPVIAQSTPEAATINQAIVSALINRAIRLRAQEKVLASHALGSRSTVTATVTDDEVQVAVKD